jgi:hypothetical protein
MQKNNFINREKKKFKSEKKKITLKFSMDEEK